MTDELNIFNTIEQIQNVLEDFEKKISNSGENFDIYSSSIDIRMIVACVVVYLLVRDERFGGFDNYISELYNGGYFSGARVSGSVLVELPDVFKCIELKRTKLDFERVKMLMNCYNRLVQKILGLSVSLEPKIEVRKFEPVVRKFDRYSKKTFILPDDLINGVI